MKTIEASDYYLCRTDQYWKKLGRLFKSSKNILPKYMDVSSVESVSEETYREFKLLLSELPYIGGEENMLSFVFVSSAAALAYTRVLERYGFSVDLIGTILNEVYADVYTSLPGFARWLLRRAEFSSRHQQELQNFSKESQLRKYPDNWVMEFIKGDGIEFDYSCIYTECAVLRYYQKMGAENYMPYVCAMDLTSSHALGTGLHRTMTLYYGGNCCDFHYKNGRPSLPGIPLENLPEFRNSR